MNSDQDSASTKLSHDISTDNVTVKVDKKEKKSDTEDPKPRIVLTFRSEKPGAKSSNMKIVSTEEKHEEISPRRSNRTRNQKWDSDDDNEALMSPKKDTMSENDEASDNSQAPLKRSTRRRSREADSVLASAIARKEKSYNETTVTSQRPSRRIKPTAKVLANKELHKEAAKGDSSQESGVRTRRSTRRNSVEKATSKVSYDASQGDEEAQNDASEKPQSNKKLKHLCELGLKAIDSKNEDRDEDLDDVEDEQEESNDTELDDEPDIINKLIEEDSGSESSDEEFYCSTGASRSKRPRRSTRLCSSYGGNESDDPPSPAADDEQKTRSRRTSRRWKKSSTFYDEEFDCNTAAGEEVAEATCPEEESKIIATCFCEDNSTLYAAPDDLPETVFCKAVETVDGTRVGCSHGAQRSEGGELAPLVRAGPRSPFLLACKLHNMQLRKHMCCPACGLFCTQGVFYQCSAGHLFHLECGLPYNDAKQRPGCPHCGVYSYRWQPVNCECVKVKLDMKCTNKRIYLPDQRLQCTPAYLGFSTLEPSQLDEEAIIPEDLLPPSTLDLDKLYAKRETIDYEEMLTNTPEERLCEAIIAGEEIEQLVPKILSCTSLGSAVHSAAVRGRLKALWALRRAAADMDARDAQGRTPLIATLLALLDKAEKKKESQTDADKETPPDDTKMDVTKKDDESTTEAKVDLKLEHSSEISSEASKDEDLMRVIRYLVAAGCDVNAQGPEGMSALHVAAQHGSAEACKVLLSSGMANVDLKDHGGWTPLVWAAENKHPQAVRVLLANGADATIADAEGNAAVHWCALAGDAYSLRLLLDASLHALHHTNAHADTPLHVAARQGNYACVVILLARGAQTNLENASGEIPAQVCAESESGEECRRAIAINSLMAEAFASRRFRLLTSDISRGREPFPVPCVNEIDDTPLPKDFTYVTRHVMPQQVPIDDTIETMQGCACDGEMACGTRGSACACGALSVRVWAHDGCLVPTFPYGDPPMLFECNQTCACDLRVCDNTLVSRALSGGSLACRAAVFRATGGRGWGLRALQRVRRGAPVASYCGELVTASAADARPTDHYMFALDLKPDLRSESEALCVDAALYGSAARFINHSCRPNLAPVRVFTHARDLRLPIVTLFAIADIQPGEEFTFDYGDKFWSVKSKWMKCECGTPECRYPTKATSDSE